MRLVLAAALIAALLMAATGAPAQSDAVHFPPHPHALAASASGADDFQCHKDHAGLTLASAESPPAAEARLAAALAGGGALIVADIKALQCAYCAAAIERAFLRRGDVAATFLNPREGTLTLVAKAGVDDETVRKLIERRGYEVSSIDRPTEWRPSVEIETE